MTEPRVLTSGTNLWRDRGYRDALQKRDSRIEQVRRDYGADASMAYAGGYRRGKQRREEVAA